MIIHTVTVSFSKRKGTGCGRDRVVRVVFLHPDLGIGGAERLVVEAAVALRSRGCGVQIWMAHYDPQHCFSETLPPDLPVVCVGDWLPTSMFGYFHALFQHVSTFGVWHATEKKSYSTVIFLTNYLLSQATTDPLLNML
ncbi:alpha-1,3/1,6-mannosyltransferase ALG2-like [Carassius auratus]|uniref:Alpha-1,3/1,6-mannosyltransferase ALG2-like n=1 Tax=Carassius auratus TaxID=7957 RepID=A0A6P6LI36_CARAU|nr:alpha-1,3/1,6-mannosyltransferase ALG2-like [Carassius auratus]